MPRENAAAKGRRYLAEGRLILNKVDRPNRIVQGTCRGDGAVYYLGFGRGRWWCNCPVRSDACAHLIAARLVTAVDLPSGPT